MTPYPRVGQVWVAKPCGGSPPFFSWQRFVLITRIDERYNKIYIQKVEKQNGQWTVVGRKSTARLSRFDGSYWNYAFVEWH